MTLNSRGINYLTLNDNEVNQFHANMLDIGRFDVRINDYVVFSSTDGIIIGKVKLKHNPHNNLIMVSIPYTTIGKKGDMFSPKNIEQSCYFDLLNDDSIPIKVCTGIAGTGKTKCAIKFGMNKMTDKDTTIEKLMIVRTPAGYGNDIGFFKGDKEDKLLHWNNPAKDNLENENMLTFEEMVAKGIIELDIPKTMQGRDIKNTWIIVDEAQNLTSDEFKMIGERVSEGSIITFIGDLNQTCEPKAKGDNNGLRRAFNLRGIFEFGCVELIDDVRSRTSKIFATLY